MRFRLLLALLAFVALAVTAFAWPLLISTAAERTQQFAITRTADLDRISSVAQQAELARDTTALAAEVRAYHEIYGDGLLVVDVGDEQVVAQGLAPTDPGVAAATARALTNQPPTLPDDLRPWSTDDVLLAVPVGTDTRVSGAVVLRSSVHVAAVDILWQWVWILCTALAAAVVCVLLALLLARWVLRPLRALERGVLAVTAGQPDLHIEERLGPPELRVLAAEFNRMSEAVTASVEQQKRLVADASHELRSPIARLRLAVDSLTGQVTSAGCVSYQRIRTEVAELESLSNGLLGLAHADRAAIELEAGTAVADDCDAVELLVERRETWLPTAERAGVALSAPDSVRSVYLALPDTDLKQVVDVAVDNAIKYAGAGTHVRLDCVTGSGTGRVVVVDDGPGLPGPELELASDRFWRGRHNGARGSGLGLAIARRLVTAHGGTFSVRANHPTGIVVEAVLPLAEEVVP